MKAPMADLEMTEMITGPEVGVEDEIETLIDGEVPVQDDEAETSEEWTIEVLTTENKENGMSVDPEILLDLDHLQEDRNQVLRLR